MKKIFSGLLCLLLSSAYIFASDGVFEIKDNSPVRAGETFVLKLIPSRIDSAATAVFNGQKQMLYPGTIVLKAFEHAVKYAKVKPDQASSYGKSIVRSSKFQSLFFTDFPSDGQKYSIWVRADGGALCLRKLVNGKSKELKWNWTRSKEYSWRCLGRYSADEIGKKFVLMSDGRTDKTTIDTVILAADKKFVPKGKYAGSLVFSLETDLSMVGTHQMPLKVISDNKSYNKTVSFKVESTDAAKNSVAFTVSSDSYINIPLGKSAVKVVNYPDFNFYNKEYTNFFNKPVTGIQFAVQPDFIALNCKKYPTLPRMASIPVKLKLAGLAFLHTEYWQGEMGQKVAFYHVKYSDGTSVDIPLQEEINIVGSARNPAPSQAKFLLNAKSPVIDFNLCLFVWENPYPDKEIDQVVFSNDLTRTFKEENTTVPLNVSSMSSQILLSLTGLKSMQDVKHLIADNTRKVPQENSVTVNFGRVEGSINPLLFSTNETGIMAADNPVFDRYLRVMDKIGCRIFRLHSGWSLQKVYPEGLSGPHNYVPLDNGIRKVLKNHPERKIMLCINKIPKYIDPLKKQDRIKFSELCVDLLKHFKKEGIRVEWWEIYNEVYFKGIKPDRSLWKMYNQTAVKLKKIDPELKIGGYAPCYPTISGITDFYRYCGKYIDFVSWHKYPTGSSKTSDEYLMNAAVGFGEDVKRIRRALKTEAPGKKIILALTEYNMNFNWKPHDPRQAGYKGAAWTASVLYNLIKADMDIAQTWHSRGGGTFGLLDKTATEIRPVARVLYWGNHYIKGDYVESRSSNKNIECLGFKNAENSGILIINKSSKPVDVDINLLNFSPLVENSFEGSTKVYSITESGYQVGIDNTLSKNKFTLKLQPFETRLLIMSY